MTSVSFSSYFSIELRLIPLHEITHIARKSKMSLIKMREKLGMKKRSVKEKPRDFTARQDQSKTFKVHEPICIPGLPDYLQKSFNLTKSGKFLIQLQNSLKYSLFRPEGNER